MGNINKPFDWSDVKITTPPPADYASLVDEETKNFFEGKGSHFLGDLLLVQILKELRELRAEVRRAP